MASNSGTNKRRWTAADTLHISDLPVGFIADVSAYLPKPSRAILAAAFTSSSLLQNNDLTHRLSPISTAIISAQQWDTLDFEDVEKELVMKLTDDHLDAILNSINAQDVLKRLQLCGCINIEGQGLSLLRGSKVLEQIDISLLRKHENHRDDVIVESKITDEVVLPILESISSLKHITFPPQWCDDYKTTCQFRQRYNLLFNSRGLSCSHCRMSLPNNLNWITSGDRMLQNNICYDCLKPFCDNCTDENGDQGSETLNYCSICDKDFCLDCISRTECTSSNCGNNMCSGCAETRKCQQCNGTKCEDCLYTCDRCTRTRCNDCVYHHYCDGDYCNGNKSHCSDCYNDKDFDGRCKECKANFKGFKSIK